MISYKFLTLYKRETGKFSMLFDAIVAARGGDAEEIANEIDE